ncbi:MAG: 3-deoxy-manno-octulosonate cytidylyltransferase [Pseudomonadota bacterium]
MKPENTTTGKQDVLVMIPARMASTRLPRKALVLINDIPMIVHVMRRAIEAELGRVVVATDHEDIAKAVKEHGGEAVMTGSHHKSGSDRIWEAVELIDPQAKAKYIVNLQGDLPAIKGETIRASLAPLLDGPAEIATLCAEITDDSERTDPNVVKLIGSPLQDRRMRALYFTRATAPFGEGPLYHHIGLYAYRRDALEKFVALSPSTLEMREKLEQLRAIEAGMRIDATIVDVVPIGVDTQNQLDQVRNVMKPDQRL